MSFECPKSMRNYKKCLEHQTLGLWFAGTNKQANQRIIL